MFVILDHHLSNNKLSMTEHVQSEDFYSVGLVVSFEEKRQTVHAKFRIAKK